MHGLRNTFVKLLSVRTSMLKMSLANVNTFTEVGWRVSHGDILYSCIQGLKMRIKSTNYIQTPISAQVLLRIRTKQEQQEKEAKEKRLLTWGSAERVQPLKHLFDLFTDSTVNWTEQRRIDFYCDTTEETAWLRCISTMTTAIRRSHEVDYIQTNTFNW